MRVTMPNTLIGSSASTGDEGPEESITFVDEGFAIDSFAAPVDSGGDTWLAEDHGPSDPSDGLKPTESLLPTESIRPTESLGTAFDEAVMADCPILSNPNESGDFYLI